jgi:hypothetical protein
LSNNPLHRMLLLVPMFGPMQARRNIRDFFDSLGLLLEAGVPMLDALPIADRPIRRSRCGVATAPCLHLSCFTDRLRSDRERRIHARAPVGAALTGSELLRELTPSSYTANARIFDLRVVGGELDALIRLMRWSCS